MVKFVAVYKKPGNPEEFDRRYQEEHVPLVRKVPGLQHFDLLKFKKNLLGGELDIYMIAELSFGDGAAFKAAAQSPEWAACGANIQELAKDGMGVYLTDVEHISGGAHAPAAV